MPPKSKSNQTTYSAKNIVSLTPREHIRRRPGMYIGGTDSRALHSLLDILFDELIETSIDQDYVHIDIELHPNRQIVAYMEDNEFLSAITPSKTHCPHLMLLMESAAGIWNTNGKSTLVSRGLHGIYLDAINALSSSCVAEVWCDNVYWRQEYSEGLPVIPLQRLLIDADKKGIRITFTPDYTIFDDIAFDFQQVASRCRELSYLISNVNFTLRSYGDVYNIEETYKSNNLSQLLDIQHRYTHRVNEPIQYHKKYQFVPKYGASYPIEVTLAFHYIEANVTCIKSFVNTVETTEGGTHVDGFCSGIFEMLTSQFEHPPTQVAIENGLLAIIHINHPDPQFESQTRVRLLNPEVEKMVTDAVQQAIDTQPEVFKMLIDYIRTQ